MNIAVVGGGTRCLLLLELIESHVFRELHPSVVAVADRKADAPGLVKAREDGLFVTTDYNGLFGRDDIDLIIELTGKREVFNDILRKKKGTVRAIDHRTAQLFWELRRVSSAPGVARLEVGKTGTMYDVVINDLIQEDVMVIGPYHRIVDINDTMLKKLGLVREEVIGRHCYEISHHRNAPCAGEEHPCPFTVSLSTMKPSQTTHVHQDKDDRELYYSISCYPIFDNGEVMGAIEISKDITKDIHMQKRLMQQEKLASIGHLAAGVAHEINNPLTTILTTAMLIQEDMGQEDPNYEELQTITNEALRCRKIVTSLLNFARRSTPAKKENDINDIVRESLALTRKQAAFKDVTVEHRLSEEIPLIKVDRDQIQQSLINLALNAIEATESGGVVSFDTRFVSGAGVVEIDVSDSGKGISEEDLDRIFDPFFTSKESGTGLGLAITHGIIQQHGGTIEVNSRLGQGTTFTVRLPITKGDGDAS